MDRPSATRAQGTTEQDPFVLRTAPDPDRRTGDACVALGVVTFVSGGFLIVMFVSMSQGASAAPWGPINDALSAAGNVVLAFLVPLLSSRAARTARSRAFVRVISAACLAAAASGALLVARVLPFEPSTAISMVVIVLQCGWMLWLNRAWARDPGMPRHIARFGSAFGAGLLGGMGLAGASLLLPWGSLAANALLIPGAVVGGAMWILWPLWFIALGRHLRRTGAGRP